MRSSNYKSKVFEEIELVPEDKLRQVYDFVHYFRLGLEASQSTAQQVTMQFAGSWKGLPDEIFSSFCDEITQRRQRAFLRRRSGETGSG